MKKIALAVGTLLAVIGAGSAFAATDNLTPGVFGLNVSTQAPSIVGAGNPTFVITGKSVISRDMVLLVGFGLGLRNDTPTGGASTSGNDLVLLAGARKYFSSGDFSPFVGGRFEYAKAGMGTSSTAFTFAGEAGAEYFLNKHFSFEGSVGFGYTSLDYGTGKSSYFGTNSYGLSANFYF